MTRKRRLLILTADTGFGHRSAARAVADVLAEEHGDECECIILNPAHDGRAPSFLRDSQRDYDRTVRSRQAFYRLTYEAIDSPVPSAIMESALTVLLSRAMRGILSDMHPDAILSTYHIYQAPMGAVLAERRSTLPFFAAITDLGAVHELWLQPSPHVFFVPNEAIRDQAIASGIDRGRIIVSGIPVDPRIRREKRSKAEIRGELGWDADLLTLLAVGSRRVDHMIDNLDCLNHCGYPIQVAVVAGGDDTLHRQLQGMEWHIPAHLYGFVSNIPGLMRAADILVSKAGGLITAEGLACGLPVILIDALPGQEAGNVAYICENRAGVLVRTPLEMLETLSHWLQADQKELKQVSLNAGQLGKPEAAYRIAEVVWQAMQASTPHPRPRRQRALPDR